MFYDLIQTIPNKPIHLYDLGAKYKKFRKMFKALKPNIIYHGVRARASMYDIAYITQNNPHREDIICDTYDDFYNNLPSGYNYYLMLDSAYYIT